MADRLRMNRLMMDQLLANRRGTPAMANQMSAVRRFNIFLESVGVLIQATLVSTRQVAHLPMEW